MDLEAARNPAAEEVIADLKQQLAEKKSLLQMYQLANQMKKSQSFRRQSKH